MHGLQARRIVDMGHGGYVRAHHIELVDAEQYFLIFSHSAAAVFAYVSDEQHIRRSNLLLKPLAHLLGEHRGSERPERFSEFNAHVQRPLSGWVAGVS